MSSVSPGRTTAVTSDVLPAWPPTLRQRIADYAELARPRIAAMTMVSVAVGFTLASPVAFHAGLLLTALLGIVLLVAASSILNQCLERHTDARMERTAQRPIVSGRISVAEAVSVTGVLSFLGTILLWQFVNPLTAVGTFMTFAVYTGGYTLLKTRTSLCTTIGAIPGAMPPVLGWFAAGGQPGIEALALFGVFFVWQFPHFLAIGWIHRDDYERAGLRMLPSFQDGGRLTGILALVYATVFVPIAVLPSHIGVAGDLYASVALLTSLGYLAATLRFAFERSTRKARQLLAVSLICLPCLLIALVVDFIRLTSL